MKFIIHQIKIWFKTDQRPRVFNFEPNKINVITGDSGTGKTNLLAIIDYCLLSSKNNIVQQVINENAEWYSLRLTINNTCYFIARKKELLGQDSSAVCFIDNGEEPIYPVANSNINDVRNQFNRIIGITNITPYKKYKGDDFKISYRTNLVFSYLTERIISLDNVFFDFDFFSKCLYKDHERDIFDSAIGYDYSRLIKYKQELEKLTKQNDKFDKWQKNEIAYKQSMENLLIRAQHNRLIDNITLFDTIDCYSEILLKMVDNYKQFTEAEKTAIDLTPYKKELSSLKIEKINIKRIESEFRISEENASKIKDVLSPIKIIDEQDDKIVRSFETQQLIDALKLSLEQLQQVDKKRTIRQIIPQTEKDKIDKRIKELKKILDNSKLKDVNVKNSAGYAFVEADLIGRELTKLLDKRKSCSKEGADCKVENFPQRSLDLNEKIRIEETSRYTLLNSFNTSMQFFYNRLKSMGVYSNCEVNFDMEGLVVKLKEIGSSYHYEKIGSKSNDMFLHLCCFLGIHKVALDMKNTQKIFPFLFIDQPSIPYYSGSDMKNDDKDKLIDAFTLLNDFVTFVNKEYKKEFQIILIEHAPKSYWIDTKLLNFHTVEEFTEGNKLIPNEIIESR